ncbi:hypothetical protein PAEPH01_0684 [Pancytospora epiphaga]|nr:hypothetical protein PAEPH01_0684 [Pancytospora epiphaga]
MNNDTVLKLNEFIFNTQDKARYCYLHICNMFGSKTGTCLHCKKRSKTVNYLATQCDKMLCHDYIRGHDKVVRCIHLNLKHIIYMYYHECVYTLSRR